MRNGVVAFIAEELDTKNTSLARKKQMGI